MSARNHVNKSKDRSMARALGQRTMALNVSTPKIYRGGIRL